MFEENPLTFPNEDERKRRKKILEKNFVDNICPNYDLDPEKALYANKNPRGKPFSLRRELR
jgi:hypothetical protein